MDLAPGSMAVISRAEAKALGLKRYFTGKPCKWGHVAERYIGGVCLKCDSERTSNPAKKKAKRHRRYWANPEKGIEDTRRWRAANPGKRLESDRQRRAIDPQKEREKENLRIRRWREAHYNDSIRRLTECMRTRVLTALKGTRKSKHTMEYVGCTVEFLKEHLMRLAKGTNFTWENRGKVWHIDHLRPLAMFDLNNEHDRLIAFNWSNMRPLDAFANMRKHDRPPTTTELRDHYTKLLGPGTFWQSVRPK